MSTTTLVNYADLSMAYEAKAEERALREWCEGNKLPLKL